MDIGFQMTRVQILRQIVDNAVRFRQAMDHNFDALLKLLGIVVKFGDASEVDLAKKAVF